MTRLTSPLRRLFPLLVLATCLAMGRVLLPDRPMERPLVYIVQGSSAAAAAAAVVRAGGVAQRPLALIDATSASLNPQALARLRGTPNLVLHADGALRATGGGKGETNTNGYLLYPAATTGAHLLHEQKIATAKSECREQAVVAMPETEQRDLRGWGVTIAVVDSGFMQMKNASAWKFQDSATGTLVAQRDGRCIVYRDFLPRLRDALGRDLNDNLPKNGRYNSTDQNGHGTHVVSTIADNRAVPLAPGRKATPVGVAPQANLLIARALDKDGVGSYTSVIAAIEWVVANKARYNVRVLNLSLYAPVTGPYWADPLNQAVMKAWQAGIVVVTAAGNAGPEAGTITVPGNVPYVITVGALRSGRYNESGSDELADYSSRGPTESAFVKPDLLVPASRTIAPMPTESLLAGLVAAGRIQEKASVDYQIGAPEKEHAYYQLSGTSMAAAQVSGMVALMLQASPALTNDQVKYRLLAGAKPAWDSATDQLVYTPWEQGAGLADIQAVFATSAESANAGMDISQDLVTVGDAQVHYWGNTQWSPETGQFVLIDPASGQPLSVWEGARRIWTGGGQAWTGARRIWTGSGQAWTGARRIWTGGLSEWATGASLWAGARRIWTGSATAASLAASSRAELLLHE